MDKGPTATSRWVAAPAHLPASCSPTPYPGRQPHVLLQLTVTTSHRVPVPAAAWAFPCTRQSLPLPRPPPPPPAGTPILEYYNLQDVNKWAMLGIIVAFFGGWSLLAWFALAFVRHQKR